MAVRSTGEGEDTRVFVFTDPPRLTLLFVSEKETRRECCVGLLRGTARIKKLLKPPGKLVTHYLEWEEIRSKEPGLEDAAQGTLVHLVLHSALPDPGLISFVFPGQDLILATLDEEIARLVLEDERSRISPEFVQLWSVPVGWEVPGLEDFLDRARGG